MRVTGFSAIMAGLAAVALMLLALPVLAAGGGHAAPSASVAAPAAPLPPQPIPMLDVPPEELSETLRPAEPPPGDFTAAQYIDSAGCVFVRVPGSWRARIARDGTPICGYPPTFSARRTGPEIVTPLFPEPEEPRAQRIERILTETILPALHEGELVAPSTTGDATHPATPAPAVAQANSPPPPPAAAPLSAIPQSAVQAAAAAAEDPLGFAASVAQAPAIRARLAGTAPQQQLCDLIGAAPAAEQGRGGAGLALGFCGPTLKSPELALQVASSEEAAAAEDIPRAVAETGVRAASNSGKATAAAAPKPAPSAAATPSRGASRETPRRAETPARDRARRAAAERPAREAPAGSGQMMIPPGARFVQIGAFRDAANAERAARRLTGMGLPVARSNGGGDKPLQVILVGPLEGREAMVRTIDRLRRAGYRDAYPRR